MTYWFSSDFHFWHNNIRTYENRPFKDIQEMNESIILRHNERVKEPDILYFLGDLGFYCSQLKEFRGEGMHESSIDLLNKINCHTIRVKGNHDRKQNKNFTPNHRLILNLNNMYINLVHKPDDTVIEDEKYYYPLTLCGHLHGKFKTKEITNGNKIALIINVSVENNNYYPFSFDEIMSIYYQWLNKLPEQQKRDIIKWNKQSRIR